MFALLLSAINSLVMHAFLSLGRWFFAIPIAIFGFFHFMNGSQMVDMIPNYLPVPYFWLFLAGSGLVAASVAILLGKYDKLAATLLAVELMLFILLLHLPAVMRGDPTAMGSLMKDFALAGAALLYAQYVAKDRSVIG